MGKGKDFETVLYFDCDGRVELHKEIQWNDSNWFGKIPTLHRLRAVL